LAWPVQPGSFSRQNLAQEVEPVEPARFKPPEQRS
jgi:hypothetical protein